MRFVTRAALLVLMIGFAWRASGAERPSGRGGGDVIRIISATVANCVAVATGDGRLVLFDAIANHVLWETHIGGRILSLQLGPGGRFLAATTLRSSGATEVCIYDTLGAKDALVREVLWEPATVHFRADGWQFLIARDTRLSIYCGFSGNAPQSLTTSRGVTALPTHDFGYVVLFGGNQTTVWMPDQQREIPWDRQLPHRPIDAVWHPSGQVAVLFADRIELCDPATGQVGQSLRFSDRQSPHRGDHAFHSAMAFSDAGDRLLTLEDNTQPAFSYWEIDRFGTISFIQDLRGVAAAMVGDGSTMAYERPAPGRSRIMWRGRDGGLGTSWPPANGDGQLLLVPAQVFSTRFGDRRVRRVPGWGPSVVVGARSPAGSTLLRVDGSTPWQYEARHHLENHLTSAIAAWTIEFAGDGSASQDRASGGQPDERESPGDHSAFVPGCPDQVLERPMPPGEDSFVVLGEGIAELAGGSGDLHVVLRLREQETECAPDLAEVMELPELPEGLNFESMTIRQPEPQPPHGSKTPR